MLTKMETHHDALEPGLNEKLGSHVPFPCCILPFSVCGFIYTRILSQSRGNLQSGRSGNQTLLERKCR